MQFQAVMPRLLPLQFHHLFPLDDEAVILHAVPVVVAQKPVPELTPPLDHLEEIRQPVGGIVSVQLLLDTGGSAVGQNTVHFPAGLFQILYRLLVLRVGGQLLGPPGDALHPEHLPCPALEPIFPLEIGGRRVEDAVLYIMRGGAAHGEEGDAADLEDLSPHEVNHMRADIVDFPAMPVMDGELVEPVEILMVSVHKKGGKRLFLQPVEPVGLPG